MPVEGQPLAERVSGAVLKSRAKASRSLATRQHRTLLPELLMHVHAQDRYVTTARNTTASTISDSPMSVRRTGCRSGA